MQCQIVEVGSHYAGTAYVCMLAHLAEFLSVHACHMFLSICEDALFCFSCTRRLFTAANWDAC